MRGDRRSSFVAVVEAARPQAGGVHPRNPQKCAIRTMVRAIGH